ncbi:hypothetical protein PLESTF_000024000 [Pleodorina starrii]|nr:hypothetical protein PLESTF_000024000 [Pleodorina starrii]
MSWVSTRNNRSDSQDEGKKTAKWMMKQAEKDAASTVYLLNLLQDLHREIEARDEVMRESSIVVSQLKAENDALKQQLLEREGSAPEPHGSMAARTQQRDGSRLSSGASSSRGSEPPSRFTPSGRCPAAATDCESPRGGSGGGVSDAGVGPRPKCKSLQAAWVRMRVLPEADPPAAVQAQTQPATSTSTSNPTPTPTPTCAACESPLPPPTPQSHSPVPAAAQPQEPGRSAAAAVKAVTAVSAEAAAAPLQRQGAFRRDGSTDTPAGALSLQLPLQPQQPPQHQAQQQQQAPAPALPPPTPQPLQAHQLPPPVAPQQQQQQQRAPPQQSPSPQFEQPPPLLPKQQPPPPPQQLLPSQQQQQLQLQLQQLQQQQQHEGAEQLQRLETRCATLTAEVSALRQQLDAARHEAATATSNYLTTKKDLEVLNRKYDSLMLQKLDAEEQRDRLFDPEVDMALVRAAMPAVDAALSDAEERLRAVVEMLATNQIEADDAARLYQEQRRKWIAKLEAQQARLAERDARVAELEAAAALPEAAEASVVVKATAMDVGAGATKGGGGGRSVGGEGGWRRADSGGGREGSRGGIQALAGVLSCV